MAVDNVKVDLKLEYLNTSSTKKLLNLLIALDENHNIDTIDVRWYYEFDDLDMEDLGSIYADELKRIKIQLIEGVDLF